MHRYKSWDELLIRAQMGGRELKLGGTKMFENSWLCVEMFEREKVKEGNEKNRWIVVCGREGRRERLSMARFKLSSLVCHHSKPIFERPTKGNVVATTWPAIISEFLQRQESFFFFKFLFKESFCLFLGFRFILFIWATRGGGLLGPFLPKGFGCNFFLNGSFFVSLVSLRYPLFSLFCPLHFRQPLKACQECLPSC